MHKHKTPPMRVVVRDPSDISNPRIVTVSGARFQWALKTLMEAGHSGLTGADLPPGTAWNRYVHELRRLGIQIETTHEWHGGEFAGTHGRFRLVSVCTIPDAVSESPDLHKPEPKVFGGAA